MVPRPLQKLLSFIFRILFHALSGLLVLGMIGFPLYIGSLPDLSPWHTRVLPPMFAENSPVDSFEAYLAREKKIFWALETLMRNSTSDDDPLNRYNRGSVSFPEGQSGTLPNWNKSFELVPENPAAGVLLVHGMSDSPFSLLESGQSLYESGARILALRLPGHGTIPSALLHTTWEEMARAVGLAVTHLKEKLPDKPIYIVGYSTGAALGLRHVIENIDSNGPAGQIQGLVMVSPAMGVTPLATLAAWNRRVSSLPGCEKLAWVDIQPEYNPYKYNSFPANAGEQVYRLTRELKQQVDRLTTEDRQNLPPILAFQSLVDATVSTRAVLDHLFTALADPAHELVLFDINRYYHLNPLLAHTRKTEMDRFFPGPDSGFTATLVTNRSPVDTRVEARTRKNMRLTRHPLDMAWPRGIFSLSHVALPFSAANPVYGRLVPGPDQSAQGIPCEAPADLDIINLGDAVLRGERGLLKIPESDILRLKWNPFYPYMEDRILNFIDLKSERNAE